MNRPTESLDAIRSPESLPIFIASSLNESPPQVKNKFLSPTSPNVYSKVQEFSTADNLH